MRFYQLKEAFWKKKKSNKLRWLLLNTLTASVGGVIKKN